MGRDELDLPWHDFRSLLIACLAVRDTVPDEKVRTLEAVLDQAMEYGSHHGVQPREVSELRHDCCVMAREIETWRSHNQSRNPEGVMARYRSAIEASKRCGNTPNKYLGVPAANDTL